MFRPASVASNASPPDRRIANDENLVPSTHRPIPSTHRPIPSTHRPIPSTHRPIPSTHRPIPSTHRPIPSTHRSGLSTASTLGSGALSSLTTSERPNKSAKSVLGSTTARRPLGSVGTNQPVSTAAATSTSRSKLSAAQRSIQPRAKAEISVVIPYRPDCSSRSRSRSHSAHPPASSASSVRPDKAADTPMAIEAEGGLMTPPASGMSTLSSSQLNQSTTHMPHPTSPTPLQPRSRTQSPQKRTALPQQSTTTLTPGALGSTPTRNKKATDQQQTKRTRELVETPVLARIRKSGSTDRVPDSSPNPRARKNTRTFQPQADLQASDAAQASDTGIDSDVPLAQVIARDTRALIELSKARKKPSSSSQTAKTVGKGKARVRSGAPFREAFASSDDDDDDDDLSGLKNRRNGPEASFLREAREKGWDRVVTSPVRTIYLRQEQRAPVRAKSKTPRPASPHSSQTPVHRASSRSASRPVENFEGDQSTGNVSNQSIKSSSSQSSTDSTTRKTPGPASTPIGQRRGSGSVPIAEPGASRKTTANRRSSRRLSAPPPILTGEVITDQPAMPDSPSDDPLLLVGPDPEPSIRRYTSSFSYSRQQESSPSTFSRAGRGQPKPLLGLDTTFAIPEEGESEESAGGEGDDHMGYDAMVLEDTSMASPSKPIHDTVQRSARVMTSTPLPGARRAAALLPSEIALPSSEPATPATNATDRGFQIASKSAAGTGEAIEVSSEEEDSFSKMGQPGLQGGAVVPSIQSDRGLQPLRPISLEASGSSLMFGQDGYGSVSSDESEDGELSRSNDDDDAQEPLDREDGMANDGSKSEDQQRQHEGSNGDGDERSRGSRAEESWRSGNSSSQRHVNGGGADSSSSDSEMEFIGQGYNRDQDARLRHAEDDEGDDEGEEEGGEEDDRKNGRKDGEDDDEEGDESDGIDGTEARVQEQSSSLSSLATLTSSDSESRELLDEAETSRIDGNSSDVDQGQNDAPAKSRDAEHADTVEILAGNRPRDGSPELPSDSVSEISSDGFEVVEVKVAAPPSVALEKRRAVPSGPDSPSRIHTLQLMHADDVPAANASRSMVHHSHGGNHSMATDASSASAYSRFLRLSQPKTTPIIEISSLDPRAAARATAILKLYHQYVDEGWIYGEETGDDSHEATASSSRTGTRVRTGTKLPDNLDPRERAQVEQVVRILQEAERIAAGQRGDRGDGEASHGSTSRLDEAGSLTLPQILMDAEINLARKEARTGASSDDDVSVRGAVAPEGKEPRRRLQTPQTSATRAGRIDSPSTPFVPGGFRSATPAAAMTPVAEASLARKGNADGIRPVDPSIWRREDWLRLDRFFSARIRLSAREILKAELSRQGAEELSQAQIMDVDKVELQVHALTSVDVGELVEGFLDDCQVAAADRRLEWASSKMRFRIPALQRKYLRKLETKHPGRITAEHVSLLDRSSRGNASLSTLGSGGDGNDSIATEDLDWSLTGMTTRIGLTHGGGGGDSDADGRDRSGTGSALRPKAGKRGGRVSFGTPYRLGTHSTPMPALKRVQQQAKQDGLYPSLPPIQRRAAEAPKANDFTTVPAKTSHSSFDQDRAAATTTPSLVTRTTRLLSRVSGSFLSLVASPSLSLKTGGANKNLQDESMASPHSQRDPSSPPRDLGRASDNGASTVVASKNLTLKKAKARQKTPVRDFGASTRREDRDSPVGIESPPASKPTVASSRVEPHLQRKSSITAADLQAAGRSIRQKGEARTANRKGGSSDGVDRAENDGSSSSSSSRRQADRLPHRSQEVHVPASASTSGAASTASTGKGKGTEITIRRSNSGRSYPVHPTALALLSPSSHQVAREKVRQLADSRGERGWKSPRTATRTARIRPEVERRVQAAATAEVRRHAM